MDAHPRDRITWFEGVSDAKVPVYCGLCERIVEAHKACNAKYVMQHCEGKGHSHRRSPTISKALAVQRETCNGYVHVEGKASNLPINPVMLHRSGVGYA